MLYGMKSLPSSTNKPTGLTKTGKRGTADVIEGPTQTTPCDHVSTGYWDNFRWKLKPSQSSDNGAPDFLRYDDN